MTTPLPAPPAVNSADFRGYVCPPEVQAAILSLLVDSAPFAASLTQVRISSGSVVFPVAGPTGAAWVAELGQIPLMTLNDDAVIVAACKLAGLLDVSNEMMWDSAFNLTAQFGTLLRDSLSLQLDQGLIGPGTPPAPAGVLAAAPVATGTTLLAAVAAAKGAIGDAGGVPSTLAMSGTAMAAADSTVTTAGALVYPGGFAEAVGLEGVVVPGLATPLVYDSTRCYCIVNGELSSVDMSTDYRFEYDATTFRVKARVNCAVPAPNKSIRQITVAP